VERGCLGVRPDSCPFRAIYVLHYFVLDISENMVTGFVFFRAYFCANFDEEGIFLQNGEQMIDN